MCSACPNLVDLNCLQFVTEYVIYRVNIGEKNSVRQIRGEMSLKYVQNLLN